MQTVEQMYAVVPAGGAGTRLWPLSRQGSPKFLHDLTGTGRSLLQQTVDRLRPVVGDRVLVVTGEAHREQVVAQLPRVAPDDVLAEPSARDSMAAIGLAAAILERRDPEAVMGSFAADHVVDEPDRFARCVQRAAAAAAEGWLVTIGIEPTHPATGFGYVRLGAPLEDHAGVHRAAEFVEKPDRPTAVHYLASGEYRWNAGMFVARPGVLLDLLAEGDPAFAAALRAIAAEPTRLAEVWPSLPRIALDHAVAEPAAAAGRVAVVPGDFGWDDIGDFDALAGLLAGPAGRVPVLGDPDLVDAPDGAALVVPGSGRRVAVLGGADLVVVDTPDAVLVTTRDRAQEVKQVVARLREHGREHLL